MVFWPEVVGWPVVESAPGMVFWPEVVCWLVESAPGMVSCPEMVVWALERPVESGAGLPAMVSSPEMVGCELERPVAPGRPDPAAKQGVGVVWSLGAPSKAGQSASVAKPEGPASSPPA